jgi:hypothetical protein
MSVPVPVPVPPLEPPEYGPSIIDASRIPVRPRRGKRSAKVWRRGSNSNIAFQTGHIHVCKWSLSLFYGFSICC